VVSEAAAQPKKAIGGLLFFIRDSQSGLKFLVDTGSSFSITQCFAVVTVYYLAGHSD
jgi:hypothetical protein